MQTHPLPIGLLILDLDGTVRRCIGEGQPCPNRPGQQELIPGMAERIRSYLDAGVPVSFASNQGGVAYGYLDKYDLTLIESELRLLLWDAAGIRLPSRCFRYACEIDEFYRKPGPGMLLDLAVTFHVELERCLMVGNQQSDSEAACAAGMTFMHVDTFLETPLLGAEDEPS